MFPPGTRSALHYTFRLKLPDDIGRKSVLRTGSMLSFVMLRVVICEDEKYARKAYGCEWLYIVAE